MTTYSIKTGDILENRFLVGDIIGEGGYGIVHEAEYLDIQRRVALKFLKTNHRRNPQMCKRFEREAKIAGRVNHDNICETLYLGKTDGDVPFFVMPLLRGTTLKEWLNDPAVTAGRFFDVVLQMLSGLDAAHNAGVVHRDFKPGNIFITQVGDRRDFVKILDFGVALSPSMEQENDEPCNPSGRLIIGTPQYMSPEQARGQSDICCQTDLFSLGTIIFEACTGQMPFGGKTHREIAFNIATKSPTWPSMLNSTIGPKLEAFILKSLEKSALRRFSGAARMARELKRIIHTESVDTVFLKGVHNSHAPLNLWTGTHTCTQAEFAGCPMQMLAASDYV